MARGMIRPCVHWIKEATIKNYGVKPVLIYVPFKNARFLVQDLSEFAQIASETGPTNKESNADDVGILKRFNPYELKPRRRIKPDRYEPHQGHSSAEKGPLKPRTSHRKATATRRDKIKVLEKFHPANIMASRLTVSLVSSISISCPDIDHSEVDFKSKPRNFQERNIIFTNQLLQRCVLVVATGRCLQRD